MASAGVAGLVRFGAFEFDLTTRELRKHGIRLKVADQSLEILAMLVAGPGQLVAREAIRSRLWPHGTVVEFEHSVNAAVKRLRDALSDTAAAPQYIETVHKKGYRFIAPVEPSSILQTVRKLSHYEILDRIGEGGMGVVYKVRDTRLGRLVALKVLPAEAVEDPDRQRRFTQEARAASALNHPNIVTIYDIGAVGDQTFIAMELVSGTPLDRVIPPNGLPLRPVLKYGAQIAEALAAAHSAGIVHRDIKPANIVVTATDSIKVLDFGLAKLAGPPTGTESTLTAAVGTKEGAILGTVAYMSPEQAEGKPVDGRSDIFSLGSVLYEMATGQRAFAGDSSLSTLASILRDEPRPVTVLTPDAPPKLEQVINRCLRKDPSDRFQRCEDLKAALDELNGSSDSGSLSPVRTPRFRFPNIRRALLAAAAVILVGAASSAVWLLLGRGGGDADSALTAVPFTTYEGLESYPSFSPDGNQIAFIWWPHDPEQSGVYVRMAGSDVPQRRAKSQAPFLVDLSPSWSPDGRWIAYVRIAFPKQQIVLIPAIGGPEQMIAEMVLPNPLKTGISGPYLAWSADSEWIIGSDRPSGAEAHLFAWSLKSREKRQLTTAPEKTVGDTGPGMSPDGRTVVFVRTTISYDADLYAVAVGPDMKPRGQPKRITSDRQWTQAPAWTPDGRDLVYSAGTTHSLWRVAASGRGKPRKLIGSDGDTEPAVSRQAHKLVFTRTSGDLNVYAADLAGPGGPATNLIRLAASTRRDTEPQMSVAGGRIAFLSDRSGSVEIWTADAAGGGETQQLTAFGGPPLTRPIWSPDGKQIAFGSNAGGTWSPHVVNAFGGSPAPLKSVPGGVPSSWSHDGKAVYVSVYDDVWKVPVDGSPAAKITRRQGRAGIESPDGAFLYYAKGSMMGPALYRMDLSTGAEEQVLPAVSNDQSWVPVADGIYFANPGFEQNPKLMFLSFSTRSVKAVEGVTVSGSFHMVENGRRIVFARMDNVNSDLMLIENFR